MEASIIGQRAVIWQILVGLVGNGHLLLEGLCQDEGRDERGKKSRRHDEPYPIHAGSGHRQTRRGRRGAEVTEQPLLVSEKTLAWPIEKWSER